MEPRSITERQQRCIYALHRRMNTEVPAEIAQLDVRTASMYIDRLKEQLDKPAQVGEGNGAGEASAAPATTQARCLPYGERATFGLASKLVFQNWTTQQKRVLGDRDGFKQSVKETFTLLRELERELAQSQSAWRLVFAHHAPYVSGRVASFERMRWPFKQWGADAVLSGYFHVYERLSVDGLPYFVNGLGGAYISGFGNTDPNSRFRYDQDNGAMLIDASDVSITFRLVSRSGQIVDEYALAKSRTK